MHGKGRGAASLPIMPRKRPQASATVRNFLLVGYAVHVIAPPKGLHTAGRALWRAHAARFVMEPHELTMLRDACRAEDLASSLWPRALAGESTAMRQWRQAVELKRTLLVACRFPVEDVPGARRPQRRPPRGSHGLASVDDIGV
jgi:hypothetical protein